jgi:chaperonin cofactor prefoldin
MTIEEALKEIGNVSLETDKALLRLGEALADKVQDLQSQVGELRRESKKLSDRLDALLMVYEMKI